MTLPGRRVADASARATYMILVGRGPSGILIMTETGERPEGELYGCRGTADERGLTRAMLRGALHRCPRCGKGGLFRAYLKVREQCLACGEDLSHQRADDAPPYVTIFVVGHLIVASLGRRHGRSSSR